MTNEVPPDANALLRQERMAEQRARDDRAKEERQRHAAYEKAHSTAREIHEILMPMLVGLCVKGVPNNDEIETLIHRAKHVVDRFHAIIPVPVDPREEP